MIVDVWTVSLEVERAPTLSPEEQTRAARFIFERDRVKWARARTALRTVLAQYAGTNPGDLVFAYGENGKPRLEGVTGVEFNLSHAGAWAMVAVALGPAVGVDLEAIRLDVNIADLLRRVGERDLPTSREDLFQVWTRREARTKATGGQLMRTPIGDLRLVDLAAPEGYRAALAMVGHDPEVRYRSAI